MRGYKNFKQLKLKLQTALKLSFWMELSQNTHHVLFWWVGIRSTAACEKGEGLMVYSCTDLMACSGFGIMVHITEQSLVCI